MSPVGEIIDISFTTVTCESSNLNDIPTPGTFIRFDIDDYTVIACVTRYDIGSIESDGYPMALWKTEAELKNQYPQLEQILKGYFKCLVLGFMVDGKFINGLPDRSIRLHTMVVRAQNNEILLATQDGLFLNSVIKSKDVDIIEVIPWLIYNAYKARNADHDYLEEIGKELNVYLKYDLNLLAPIIERLENMIINL